MFYGRRMQLILIALSTLCASVPMLAFLLLIWWLDRYDREPIWLVLLTFAWGAFGATGLSLILNSAFASGLAMALGPEMADMITAPLVAPLVEEPMKALILFVIMFSRHYDSANDGFVYGAAAGLGFGMTENFLYFYQVSGDTGTWMQTVFIRTFFSALMHAGATSAVGAALGYARFSGTLAKVLALPAAFFVACGMHFAWNGLLTLGGVAGSGWPVLLNFLLFPLEFLALFLVFQFALWHERKVIRRELADEVEQGLIPLAHARNIASWLKRGRRDWVPVGVPHHQYVRAATTLALRKHQCRNSTGSAHDFFREDVLRLRRELQALLALADRSR